MIEAEGAPPSGRDVGFFRGIFDPKSVSPIPSLRHINRLGT